MSEGFDLKTFAAAARDKSPAGRSVMFAQLTRLFWRRGAIMKPKERVMLAEILRLLRPKTIPEQRLELSYEIAGSTLAEPALLRVFAEDEIAIASPVLFSQNRLEASDLVDVIDSCGAAHGAVIAQRKGLTVPMVDALVRLEDPIILKRLLADPEAPFSLTSLSAALEAAKMDLHLQDLLVERRELPESLAEELLDWASPSVRESLNTRFLFDAMAASPKQPLYGARVPPPEPAVEEVKPETIELSPATLIQCLRDGNLALFQAQLAQLANLRIGLVRKLMSEPGGDSIALIARALDLRRDEFAQIYLNARKIRNKANGIGAADLGQALDFFDRTDVGQARAILARWRHDSAKEALTESEDLALPAEKNDEPAV
ncbi:DUF2336 domain-containing protein [Dongia sp.]|uniref:DUF2336 domain-containing protein n=1 Tax=Dongia sp. TaxID=1977262 RepID=UPI0035B0F66B